MKNECFIEGQISIFDLPVIEIARPKEAIIKKKSKEIDNFDSIIKLYSKSCSRIVKTLSGALLVELDDNTLYFNSKGINEFNLPINVGIMPGEEILVVNIDKEINGIQKQKLEALKPKEYIKRKGDANLIISGEKTIAINPKGWISEYEQNPRHHENEIFNMEVNLQKSDIAWIGFKVNDEVAIEYLGVKAIGKVVKVYNKEETLNVKWGGKQTAFYYKNVELAE